MSDQWDIKRVLDWTRGFLSEKGCENAKASAEWLIGTATGLSRLELYTNFERPLSPEELALLHGYVKRRAMGEPLQYISGTAAFRHITLHVRKGVLIPRPETEVLVSELLAELPPPERARAFDSSINEYGEQLIDDMQGADMVDPVDRLRALPEKRSPILVADLCTGSGCIACSLAYEHPDIEAIATDISPDALSLAQENAAALGLSERVAVIESDLGSGISDEHMGRFDAVVSNPPYVPTAVMSSLPREVSDFEPRLALDGGEDGLNFFRAIARWSLDALKPGGVLAVELYEDCLNEAQAYAASIGFASPRIADDLAGKPRVLIARAPHAHDGQQ